MKPIEQVRRENLEALVGAEPSQAAFARKIGKDKNQVNQWLGRAGRRNLSGDTARELERILGKPTGWMDQEHGAGLNDSAASAPASQSVGLDVPKLTELIETLEAATIQAQRDIPPRTKARILASLYASNASREAVAAALVSIFATLED